MLQKTCATILRLLGWKLEDTYPHHLPKMMLIVIPHTSNWDFPLGLLIRCAIGAKIKYIGKKSLFRPPLGWIFRALGGYPVDRSKSHDYVAAVAQIFEQEKELVVCMAPEGTRKPVRRLKTGFYYIAKEANVPILMVKFDYEHKVIGFAQPFTPDPRFEDTLARLQAYFKDVKGKRPSYSWSGEHLTSPHNT